MNKKVIVILCTVMIMLTGCGKVPKLKSGEEVFLKVNGKNVSAMDFYTLLKDKYSRDILIDTIDKIIFNDKYKEDAEMKSNIDSQIDSLKQQYGGDTGFESALKQYQTTEQELRDSMALDYRRNKAVEDYVKSKVTDKEIEEYYNTEVRGDIKASHIIIKSNATDSMTDAEKKEADTTAMNKIKDIIKQLDNGAKFADLAKKYGEDGTKDNGGDLGWFGKGTMDASFEAAAVALKKGEYTKEPVKSEFGYHVILKTGEKAKASLKTVKDEIKSKITTKKLSADTVLKYKALEQIRKDKGLKIYDDKVNSTYKDYMNQLQTPTTTTNTTQQ